MWRAEQTQSCFWADTELHDCRSACPTQACRTALLPLHTEPRVITRISYNYIKSQCFCTWSGVSKKQKLHVFKWKPFRNHIHPLVRKEKSVPKGTMAIIKRGHPHPGDTSPRANQLSQSEKSDSVAVPCFHMKYHLFNPFLFISYSSLSAVTVLRYLYLQFWYSLFFSLLALKSLKSLPQWICNPPPFV